MADKAILVDAMPIDYFTDNLIPEHMIAEMQRYMERGVKPGDFLTALLSNDLMGVASTAGRANRYLLPDYYSWLYRYAPSSSFGSPEAVNKWIKDHGR